MDTAHHTLHLPPHHTTPSESLTESAISASTLLLCVGVTVLALLLNLIQLLMLRRVTTLLYNIHHHPVRREEEGVQVLPQAPPPPYSHSTRQEPIVRAGNRGLPRPVPRSPTPHQERHRRGHISQARFHPLDIRSTPTLHTGTHRV